MIDIDKYMEDVDEKYNLIMNLMDDEEREFEIKSRIRERNTIIAAARKLYKENQRLREKVKTEKNLKLWEKAEVKRLREENNRYLDFILWLGIEHKGKKLAWEYGDEKIVEMIE